MLAANLTNFLSATEPTLVGSEETVADATVSFEQVLAGGAIPINSIHSSETDDLTHHNVDHLLGNSELARGETAESIVSAELQASVKGNLISSGSSAESILTASKSSAAGIAPSLEGRPSTKGAEIENTSRLMEAVDAPIASPEGGSQSIPEMHAKSVGVAQTLVPVRVQTDVSLGEVTPGESHQTTEIEQALPPESHQDSNDATNAALQAQPTLSGAKPDLPEETARELSADGNISLQSVLDSTTRDRVAAVPIRDEIAGDARAVPNDTGRVYVKPQVDESPSHKTDIANRSAAVDSVQATVLTTDQVPTDTSNAPGPSPRREAGVEVSEVDSSHLHSGPPTDQVAAEQQQPAQSTTDIPVAAYGNVEAVEGAPSNASLRTDGIGLPPIEGEQQKSVDAELNETTSQGEFLNDVIPSDETVGFDTSGQQSDHPAFHEEVTRFENDAQPTRYEPSADPNNTPDTRTQGVPSAGTSVTNETAPASASVQTRDATFRPVDVTQQITSAVMKVMESSDGSTVKTVQLELNPAELGRLKIQVEQSAESVATHIIASELVSSDLLTSKKDALLEALSDLGFGEASVDISYHENEQSDAQTNSQWDGLSATHTTNASESSSEALNVSKSTGLNIVV